MRSRIGALMVAVVLSVGVGVASVSAQTIDRKDFQLFKDVQKSVLSYAQFTIFDDVSANVKDGVVTLTGDVTMPYKKDDIGKRVAKIDGVRQVNNDIAVLGVSTFDNQLRYRIARSIYGNSNFWNYAIMSNPPIHIVVDRGRVTLTGVVQSEVDRSLARSLASQSGAFSVTNALKTDAEARSANDQSE